MPEKGDRMDTIITNATGYSSVEYTRLLEQAQAKGVSAARVDEALIDAIQAGKDFTAAVKDVRSQLPDLASPGENSGDLSGWVALPSPAAMFASVILKDAAEQRRTNRSIIQAHIRLLWHILRMPRSAHALSRAPRIPWRCLFQTQLCVLSCICFRQRQFRRFRQFYRQRPQ